MLKKAILACAVLALCAACSAPAPRDEVATSSLPDLPSGRSAAGSQATVYSVDPARSWLRVRVYRSGRLARFGHNHVMESRALTGSVALGDSPADSSLGLEIALSSFTVDDPAARSAEGADFDGEIPDKDRAATRRNMLGEALLNAASHPIVALSSDTIDGEFPDLSVVADVSLAGQVRPISFPVTVTLDGARLVATGDVIVTHEQLGLTPFTALLGALSVRDDIGLHFHIEADTPPGDDLL